MFDKQDREYFARRAAHARKLADEATDPAVKRLHNRFADEYERRAAGEKPHMLVERHPES